MGRPTTTKSCERGRAKGQGAMTDWQPIETAPKDGKPILSYCASGYDEQPYSVIWWHAEIHEWWETVATDTKKLRSEAAGYWAGGENYPTHWLPLPPPPKE